MQLSDGRRLDTAAAAAVLDDVAHALAAEASAGFLAPTRPFKSLVTDLLNEPDELMSCSVFRVDSLFLSACC